MSNDTAAIPFPPRSTDSDDVEDTTEEIEDTEDEETDEESEDEEEEAPAKPAKKAKTKSKAKPAKVKSAKKGKAKEVFSASLAPGSIEIPTTNGGKDPLRLELAEKACREDWQNCTSLSKPLRCSPITARHYLYGAAKLPGAIVQYRISGSRGVPSLHVHIPTKAKKQK